MNFLSVITVPTVYVSVRLFGVACPVPIVLKALDSLHAVSIWAVSTCSYSREEELLGETWGFDKEKAWTIFSA